MDRQMRGDLIEMHKVISIRDSIHWVKPLNIKKMEISRSAASVRVNSLIMRRESFSSRIRNILCF